MNDDAIFRAAGGRPTVMFGADPNDPANVRWNFGINPQPEEVRTLIASKPSLHSMFPALAGKWDGKTNVNHHTLVEKVTGKTMPAQQQPRGTCGGRAGSQAIDFLQCVQIATGKRAKFHKSSHAALYYFARRLYGMDKGNPSDENNDGVASGSIPEVLTKVGCVLREECGDTNFYGTGSDDLASQWGAGKISPALKAKLEEYAKDNVVTAWAPCKSAQECADGLASNGVIIVSDDKGYSMTRDNEGFCRQQGQWYHYHIRTGVRVSPSGRRGFDYNQSWGNDTPKGPLLPGCPGNVFAHDWDVMQESCEQGDVAVVFAMDLWDLEDGNVEIDHLI